MTARPVFESAVQRSGLLTEDGGQTQLAGGATRPCASGTSFTSVWACILRAPWQFVIVLAVFVEFPSLVLPGGCSVAFLVIAHLGKYP